MTCPMCGAKTKVVNGIVNYHTRPDNLAACPASRTPAQTTTAPKAEAKAEPAKPRRKTTKKNESTQDEK